jgi:hypothetical protein
MKKMFNEGNQIHNFMSSSGSGTVINYGSGSDFLTSYSFGYGSGSTSQKVTVPTVPVPVPQHCFHIKDHYPRLGQALLASMQCHLWNLSEHLVLLALADDDIELELKSKILDKLLDSEDPDLFMIEKPDLPIV